MSTLEEHTTPVPRLSSRTLYAWRLVKYAISGALGGVLQVGFLHLFVDVFGIWYLYGVVLAFVAALVIVFILQKFWTFEDVSLKRLHRQSFMYAMIAIGSLLLNVVLMYLFVDILHQHYVLSQTIIVGAVGVLSFIMNKIHTFSNVPQDHGR